MAVEAAAVRQRLEILITMVVPGGGVPSLPGQLTREQREKTSTHGRFRTHGKHGTNC